MTLWGGRMGNRSSNTASASINPSMIPFVFGGMCNRQGTQIAIAMSISKSAAIKIIHIMDEVEDLMSAGHQVKGKVVAATQIRVASLRGQVIPEVNRSVAAAMNVASNVTSVCVK